MGGELVYLPSAELLEVCPSHAPRRGSQLAAVRVDDDAQAAVGIEAGEVVVIDVAWIPMPGQYAGVETAKGFRLGYVSWVGSGGLFILEPVCGCKVCRTEEFTSRDKKSWGPVVGVCGRGGRGCRAVEITKDGARLRRLI